MESLETKVREWYMEAYPDDDLGQEITEGLTFQGLFDALDSYQDVYKVLGVGDSLVRESCFAELAEIIGESYDYVYDQWLKGAEMRRNQHGKGV